MPQRLRGITKFKNFNYPVSYRLNVKDKMRDARNVYSNQDRLDTRNGVQRFNSTQIGSSGNVLSVSFFKKSNGDRYYIAKVGTILYSVSESGAHTEIKTGLTSTTKHRSVTFGDRAIIAIESDGLFAWDGTTFSQLGEEPPAAPIVAASGSGNSLTASDYQVATTFYSTTLGFETNIGAASSTVTVASGEQIDVTGIDTAPTNGYIDKTRVYLKDITNAGEWIFWDEIAVAVSTETIDDDPASTQNPPETNAPPLAGGGKYLTVFGKKVVYAGSSQFPNDIFFSENYLPDAFDDSTSARIVLNIQGQGPVMGIGTGFFNDSNLTPYLCAFKKNRIELYAEVGGVPQVSVVSDSIGAVSHDTIQEIDGDLYFMSENGWHVIHNGQIYKKDRKAFRLGDGDVDNIFTESGYVYELNKANFDDFFSVYYPTLNQYLTFVSEAGNNAISKAYNYEFGISGFRPYEFILAFNGACQAEDSSGEDMVLLAGPDGRIYKHSINVTRHDVDADNTSVAINAFAQLFWIAHEDYDATMNFGTMIFKALKSSDTITCKIFTDYKLTTSKDILLDFNVADSGAIWDESEWDNSIWTDERSIARDVTSGIYKTAQSLLIGFYQETIDANMQLLGGQIDASKNGNPNT